MNTPCLGPRGRRVPADSRGGGGRATKPAVHTETQRPRAPWPRPGPELPSPCRPGGPGPWGRACAPGRSSTPLPTSLPCPKPALRPALRGAGFRGLQGLWPQGAGLGGGGRPGRRGSVRGRDGQTGWAPGHGSCPSAGSRHCPQHDTLALQMETEAQQASEAPVPLPLGPTRPRPLGASSRFAAGSRRFAQKGRQAGPRLAT